MQKKNKICFLVGYYPINKGGAEYQTFLIYNILKEKYNTIYISIGQEEEEIIYEDNCKIYKLKTPRRNEYYKLKYKIWDILKHESPNIIYQRVAYSVTGIATKYCKNNGCKMVWHIANKPDVERNKIKLNRDIIRNIIEKKYLEYGILNADYIIGQARYQDELLKKNYKRKCDLIVPNFHPSPREKIIKKMDRINIVWIANFKYAKQPHLFIELATLFLDDKKVRFIMVGRNPEYIKAQDIPENLKIIGHLCLNKVNLLLAEAHIFVNTSLYEGFPNTFIQAWMRKVPVVSLHVDPDDILKNNKIGFHSKNFDQMVKDIRFLIDHTSIRMHMGEIAQKYARENHSLDNIEAIQELIEGNI